jgi:hypothetical protein
MSDQRPAWHAYRGMTLRLWSANALASLAEGLNKGDRAALTAFAVMPNRKNDPFFYNSGTAVPAAADNPMWRGTSFDQLANFAYGDLVGRGVFAAPGTGPSWGDVQANLQGQGDFAGGWTATNQDNAGTVWENLAPRAWQQNAYYLGPPEAAVPDITNPGSSGG